MTIRIPEQQHRAVSAVVSAEPHQREEILHALAKAEPTLLLVKLESQLAESTDVPRELIRSVLTVASSLMMTAERHGLSGAELAEQVVDAVVTQELGLTKDSSDAEMVRDFFTALLAADSVIRTTAKANELLVDHSNPLVGSRILTDLRPIFSDGDSLEPVAGVIVHTLKLSVFADGHDKSYYFALDEDDLRELRRTVDRAIEKETALRSRLSSAEFPCLEIAE